MLRHIHLTVFFCIGILILQPHISGSAQAADAPTSYTIVLASAPGSNMKWSPQKNHLFDPWTIYIEKTTINGAQWERLCLGFFDNRKQASSLLNKIGAAYTGAWIKKSSKQDIQAIVKKPDITSIDAQQFSKGKQASLTEKQLDSLIQRAKSDFKNKKYSSAIRYFTALISAGDHKYSREALELLGLARQRKQQKAHAASIYEKYLSLYPEGDGSDRVRQRLAGLLTATRAGKEKIRMSTLSQDEVTTYGSFSQFYRNNKASTDDTDKITTISQLITFFDVTTVQSSGNYNHRYQFTSDHTYDFLDSTDNSDFRFIETYYELNYKKTGTSGRIGRQSLRIGGILNRFDGISAGYQFTPDMRLTALTGFPVETGNKTSINTDKTFYGLTFETGTFLEHWEMRPFYFDQKVEGLTDHTNVGTEVRYRDHNKSLFGMIDYDLLYKEVNIFQFNANLILEHGRTAYINAFLRKTPILATSNALIGRPEKDLDELKRNLNIEQIYQLARDRTANSQTITVGGSQPINAKFQTTADVTLSRVGDTVASGGVPASEGSGTDYFLSVQLVGNNLLVERDTGILGLRYLNTEPSDTISLIANSRFPITTNWRFNPRLQFDIRKLKDGRTQEKIRAILKSDYRYLRKVRFDFEIGYDETSENNNGQSLGSNNLFITLGYRWDF